MERCPHCHQPLTNVIEGVRLPKFKARLFALIEAEPGLSCGALAGRMYSAPTEHAPQSVRSHIAQINEALAKTSVHIEGRPHSGYRIERGHRIAQGHHANGEGVGRPQ